MVDVYILRLTDGKYYVGKSKCIDSRIGDHMNNCGSEWTKRYKYVEQIAHYPNCDSFDEDAHTLRTMAKYGIDNVRGGSFSRMELDQEDKIIIKRMINGASDKCFVCGSVSHWVRDCPINKEKYQLNWDNILDKVISLIQGVCTRCGRDSHTANKCYAKTHTKGYPL